MQPSPDAFSAATTTVLASPNGEVLGTRAIERSIRIRRLRRAGAIALWVLALVVVALVLTVGGRPAPTEFGSLGWHVT